MMVIARIACVPPRLPSQHPYSLRPCRFADKLTVITGSIVFATGQERYGEADTLLADGRNHERFQSLEAIIYRVGGLRRNSEFDCFEGEERWEIGGLANLFP